MSPRSADSCPLAWKILLDLSECQTEQGASLRLHLETCAACRAEQKALHQMLTVLHSPALAHASPDAVRRAQALFRQRMIPIDLPDPLLETA